MSFSVYLIYRNNTENLVIIDNKIRIVTSLFPLYDFSKIIAEGEAEVSLLLPPGTEAHSFEPKPSDIIKIKNADIFVYAGKYMEPWAEDVINGLDKTKIFIIDASEGIDLIKDEDGHGIDPHFWLDFDNAGIVAGHIESVLSQINPEKAQEYKMNLENFKKELMSLDEKYWLGLSGCGKNEIIQGGHMAFGYLMKRYNIGYMSAEGFNPDAEATPKDLAALSDQIKKLGLKYVYYEELIEPRMAETISRETGATPLLLHAVHNISKDDFDGEATYLSLMKKNLDNLKLGLECQI